MSRGRTSRVRLLRRGRQRATPTLLSKARSSDVPFSEPCHTAYRASLSSALRFKRTTDWRSLSLSFGGDGGRWFRRRRCRRVRNRHWNELWRPRALLRPPVRSLVGRSALVVVFVRVPVGLLTALVSLQPPLSGPAEWSSSATCSRTARRRRDRHCAYPRRSRQSADKALRIFESNHATPHRITAMTAERESPPRPPPAAAAPCR